MLEITFNDSSGGCMCMLCGSDSRFGDSLTLSFDLDMGTLQYGALSDERFRQINSWFKNDRWLTDTMFRIKDMRKQVKSLEIVRRRAAHGEKVRIWYD